MRPLWLPLLLLAGVLAGCIDDDTTDETGAEACLVGERDSRGALIMPLPYEGGGASDPIVDDHDHWDFESHNKRTCSLEMIGNFPLQSNGEPHKYIGELDMRGDLDLGAVAVLGNTETPRVYLLDISDRSAPQVVADIQQADTYVTDVKISDDGALLFTASQSIPGVGELQNAPDLHAATGFSIYNIEDPADPRYITTWANPQGLGCHMLSHEIVDGVDVLFCISDQVRAFRLDRVGSTVTVSGFVDYIPEENGVPTPSGPILVGGQGVLTSGPHDMTVQVDPVTGQPLMFVSHWDSGVRVVDLTDAPLVEEIAVWKGEGATHYGGNVHTAMMVHADGHRYVIATPEYTSSGDVPSLWVLNADDWDNLQLVGEWWAPGDHDAQGLLLTTHQWQVAPSGPDVNLSDVRIYLTYNHAGIWVLSLEEILAGNNAGAILGYNMARAPMEEADNVGNAILNTWDVNVVDGYIYGSDRATGLWLFHYTEDALGDAALTGFA